MILVRDTTSRDGGTLAFTAEAWQAFAASLRAGQGGVRSYRGIVIGSRPRSGAIVKTCGSRSLSCFRLGVLAGSFDEFAVDEGRSGTDQGDEVGGVDGAPAVLR